MKSVVLAFVSSLLFGVVVSPRLAVGAPAEAGARAKSFAPESKERRGFASDRDGVVNVLVYGDAGNGDSFQRAVGEGMWKAHRSDPFDFAVSTGDNQYVDTAPDTYRRIFEIPYAPLIAAGVPFFQAVGNHDREQNRLEDQLAYSRQVNALARGVGGWVLPSPNYVVRRGNVKWIIADAGDSQGRIVQSTATREFLEREVCEPSDDWKIVTTHYPLWSSGPRGDNRVLQAWLLPLFERCPVDFYFGGHEHHAEAFLPWKWMPSAVVGNGREIRPGRTRSEREVLHFVDEIGFARLKFMGNTARLSFLTAQGAERWVSTFQKSPPLWAGVDGVRNGRVRVRALLPRGVGPGEYEVQIGHSAKATNPVLYSRGWTYAPSSYAGFDEPANLEVWEADARSLKSGRYVTARLRRKGDKRWIYADDETGMRHGNYDGVSPSTMLRLP
jgi:hypothetical protein